MLIEFSVANFRSFREKQTLSMVAAPRLRKRENVFKPDVRGEKFPALLKVCVIYGPNASGKSNLLGAIQVIGLIANRQPSAQPFPLPVSAFRFDPLLLDQPSVFEIYFIAEGMRYQFNLRVTVDRIVGERLVSYPNGNETVLYERTHSLDRDNYEFSPFLSVEADVLHAWQKLTPPGSLFIAQAIANSSEDSNQVLRAPFDWLKNGAMVMLSGMKTMSSAAQSLVLKHSSVAEDIAQFLQDVDIPVSRMTVEASSPTDGSELSKIETINGKSNSFPEFEIRKKTTLTHTSALGEAKMDYSEESDGTQNLIGFWLPWHTRDTKLSLRKRYVLVVDEMDSSLHPKIVTVLVSKHIASDQATQLIFTTHDTHLMDAKLMRRDQFWIAERDINGATQLRAIHEFEGRESEDIEKRYYAGRYRGLPQLRGA